MTLASACLLRNLQSENYNPFILWCLCLGRDPDSLVIFLENKKITRNILDWILKYPHSYFN